MRKDFIKIYESNSLGNRIQITGLKEVIENEESIMLFLIELSKLQQNRALYYSIDETPDSIEWRISTKLEQEPGKRNMMVAKITDSSYNIIFERHEKEDKTNIKTSTKLTMETKIKDKKEIKVFTNNQEETILDNPLRKVLSFKNKNKESITDPALIAAKNIEIREATRNR